MGIPQVLGNKSNFKFGTSSYLFSYDSSGTAYLPSGETSFVIPTGYMSDKSRVDIVPVNASTGVIPLIEVLASRTYGSNGSFTVSLQDGSAALADLYFAWMVSE